MRLRTVAMMLAAAAVCVAPRAGLAQTTRAEAVASIGSSLDQLNATLVALQSTPEARLESARRLVLKQSPAARQRLKDALQYLSNQAVQLAAAKALAADPAPDPDLVIPLFACIGTSRALSEAAANALANYRSNPDVMTRLISQARSRELREDVRAAVIRAVGRFVEKPAAQFLVSTLLSPNESKNVHEAAAGALRDLTGISDYGQDPQRWNTWWNGLANKTDADFRAEVLPRRSIQYDQLHQRHSELIAGLRDMLEQHQSTADPAQRPAILMGYLNSSFPEIRAVGANIIRKAAGGVAPIPAAARDQLRNMIADSSPHVRVAVADALAAINDTAALDPLLEQLAQETDPVVRATIARALGPINDLKAVDALLALLKDPSPSVAQAAAEALELLGPRILSDNPALAQRTANELQATLQRHPLAAGNAELREALIDAMVPLKQEVLLPFLRERLRGDLGESAAIRRLALKAIGAIGNPQSAGVLVSLLEDKDAGVRLEAVTALGNLPTASEYAEVLLTRLNAEQEPSIRDKIWKVLESVFPDLSDQRLNNFVEKFPNEPNRKLAVLRALAAVQLKNRKLDDLAITHQNIGATLMDMKVNDAREASEAAREAAEFFRQALEHQRSRPNAAQQVITRLMGQRMNALLRSEQYAEAIAFAGQCIAENNSFQPEVAVPIVHEAQRLSADGKLEDSLKLIAEAMKMDPQLAEQFRDQLKEIEGEVRKKQNERRGAGAALTASPRAATRPTDPASNTASGR
jgi:HEAT repeat protein